MSLNVFCGRRSKSALPDNDLAKTATVILDAAAVLVCLPIGLIADRAEKTNKEIWEAGNQFEELSKRFEFASLFQKGNPHFRSKSLIVPLYRS
jgi:hypothetical protein